jgi:hypothetical protein
MEERADIRELHKLDSVLPKYPELSLGEWIRERNRVVLLVDVVPQS